MKVFLQKLFQGETLSIEEAEAAMQAMMRSEASPEEMAGFLGAIASRGETVAEIVGCARAMRRQGRLLKLEREDLIDVCGTGGDGADTFNISTCNALILASAGLGVAKHGNRAVSSRAGSADVLEALGIRIDLSVEEAADCLDKKGFAFLFAPLYHPAMKSVAAVRKSLGVRTLFNILGPLCNPAQVKRQVVGVFAEKWLDPVAEALQNLGTQEALVVWGSDGLDEISLGGVTHAVHLKDGQRRRIALSPQDFGLRTQPLSEVKGGDKQANARMIEEILEGQAGPKRDIVLMNAGAALVVAGLAQTWRDGAAIAAALIDSGRALAKLEQLRSV